MNTAITILPASFPNCQFQLRPQDLLLAIFVLCSPLVSLPQGCCSNACLILFLFFSCWCLPLTTSSSFQKASVPLHSYVSYSSDHESQKSKKRHFTENYTSLHLVLSQQLPLRPQIFAKTKIRVIFKVKS